MSTKRSAKKLSEILEKVSDELARAYLYFTIANILNRKYREKEIKIAKNFFYGTYYATLREAILTLSKLVLEDPESITYKYLIDHVEHHPGNLKFSSLDNTKNLVVIHRKKLETLSAFSQKIRSLRDRELAHFDRKHINDPSAIIPVPIDFSEIQECLDTLLEILNDYQLAFDNSQGISEPLEKLIESEIDYLLTQK